MNIKIKKLNELAVTPTYAYGPEDACFDITATSRHYLDNGTMEYRTGLAFEIPKGYVGLIFPRSGIYKKDMMLSNCVGVIDSGYRGEVKAFFKVNLPNNRTWDQVYGEHDRIMQMMIIPVPHVEFTVVEELSPSSRGSKGFNSSGTGKEIL